MKNISTYLLVIAVCLLTACSRYIDNRSSSSSSGSGSSGTGSGGSTPVIPPGGGSSGSGSGGTGGSGSGGTGSGGSTATTPFIKFFNVVDYGNVGVSLNGSNVGSIAQYYPSIYTTGVNGTNNIKLTYNNNTISNIGVDMIAGAYYSCFIYRVGYEWKINVVKDDLTAPATGYANIRLLDFRTQAYFDYINVRVYALGVDEITYKKRNFLDHTTYSTYTSFNSLAANSSYNCMIYNDTANLASKKGFPLNSGKIYSIILMTPTGLSAGNAIYNIAIDVEQHN
ncbi:MAG: hypothetical protein JSR09_07740 [Bacteroidetes bacterium]|nr:hypothetical protein [Bacteroidota bacterium]MBS1649584.1 hypothetical protein [Bacteroidota bacterium]